MSESLQVLVLGTNGHATFKTIPHTLAALQHEVGGYIETISLHERLPRGLIGLVDEEGWLREHPEPNPFSPNLLRPPTREYSARELCGRVVVLRTHAEEFASLTDEDTRRLRARLEALHALVIVIPHNSA